MSGTLRFPLVQQRRFKTVTTNRRRAVCDRSEGVAGALAQAAASLAGRDEAARSQGNLLDRRPSRCPCAKFAAP